MIKIIITMLSMIVSTKKAVTELLNACTAYLSATSEEEKENAAAKVMALIILVSSKMEVYADKEKSNFEKKIMEALSALNEMPSEEEQEELKAENNNHSIAEKLAKSLADMDDDGEEPFHVHNCDECRAKGNCSIESVMREVKAGKISPEEGNRQAQAIIDAEEAAEAETIPLPSVVAEA